VDASSDTPSDTSLSIQERFAPGDICFGCGHANPQGLQIRSFPDPADPEALVCTWSPEPHHQAFPGILNGGIVGTLLDCHSNWLAAWHLMRRDGLPTVPTTVTASYQVKMRHPTPVDAPVELRARAVESQGGKVRVAAELHAGGRLTATCEGTFVAVGPDHPAFRHR
jgi:acyl-coenzyme A thioesterase PaaI-like protein